MKFLNGLFSSPERPPVKPLTDKQEWAQWRSFIGRKHICEKCGLVIGDPQRHAEWHALTTVRA